MKKRNQGKRNYSKTVFDIIPIDEPWFWIGVVLTASITGVVLTFLNVWQLI